MFVVICQVIPWKKLIPALLSEDREGEGVLHTLHSTLCTLVCPLEMLVHPKVLPAAFCREERSSLPSSQHTVTTIPHSEGMRTVPAGARHHHSSPGPGNSTEPRVPPGFFSLPAWEASQCRDSAGEILSSVGSRDGPAERLRQGHSCGSGRHQMFPRQLAEAEPCCGVGHTVPFAVGLGAKRVRAGGLQNHIKPPGSPR